MSWNADTSFEVIFTDDARAQLQNILDYLFFVLNNAQAAYNVEQDAKRTVESLSHVASSLKLCEDFRLRSMGYRKIRFRRHSYFMLKNSFSKIGTEIGNTSSGGGDRPNGSCYLTD